MSGTKAKMKKPEKPELTFSYLAWCKIWYLTKENVNKNKIHYECTSLGFMDPEDPCKVLDVYVPKQVNTTGDTKVDGNDQNMWVAECMSKGIRPDQLVFWHHSHGNISVFWSGTDEENIERMDSDQIQWSVVTNAAGELKVRADLFNPMRFWWDDCAYSIEYPSIDLEAWWEEQRPKITNEAPKTIKRYTTLPRVGKNIGNQYNHFPQYNNNGPQYAGFRYDSLTNDSSSVGSLQYYGSQEQDVENVIESLQSCGVMTKKEGRQLLNSFRSSTMTYEDFEKIVMCNYIEEQNESLQEIIMEMMPDDFLLNTMYTPEEETRVKPNGL